MHRACSPIWVYIIVMRWYQCIWNWRTIWLAELPNRRMNSLPPELQLLRTGLWHFRTFCAFSAWLEHHIVPKLSLIPGNSSNSGFSWKDFMPVCGALCLTIFCAVWKKYPTHSSDREGFRSQHTDLSQRLVNSLSLSCMTQTQSLAWSVSHFFRCRHESHD